MYINKNITNSSSTNHQNIQDWHNGIRGVLSGLSGKKLCEEYGSPLYVINLDLIKQKYLNLRASFDDCGLKNIDIHYAVKANHNLSVINCLGGLDNKVGVDVVSIGEFNRARTAGIPAKSIIFSGIGKTTAELRQAIDSKVGRINIESAEEWHDILKLNTSHIPEISIRYNIDVDANTHPHLTTARKDSKFGMLEEDIYNLLQQNPKNKSLITGLAIHLGSQITDISVYKQAYDRLNQLLAKLSTDLNWKPSHLDLGGGYAVAYSENKAGINTNEIAQLISMNFADKEYQLAIEPGRYLVAEAGVLLTKVIRIKKTRFSHYAIVDAGINNFIRHALYGELHPVIKSETENVSSTNLSDSNKDLFDVVGPICESADVFCRNCYLESLKVEDIVIIAKTGAYGSVMSSTYNARSIACEVVIKNNKAYLSVPKLDKQELLQRETAQFRQISK